MWLLAAAIASPVLFDQIVSVPASQIRTLDIPVTREVVGHSWVDQRGRALMEIRFAVARPGPNVRVALLTLDEGRRLRRGMSHGVLASTSYQESGTLRRMVDGGELYVLLIDNRLEGRAGANVRTTVSLISGDGPAREASPLRRLVVIALSTIFFAGVTVWAGRRLLDAASRAGDRR
jgi:hypothetical protein